MTVLAEVLWLVLGDKVVERPDHVWEEAVVLAGNGCRHYAAFMSMQVGIIYVEGRETVGPKPSNLRNVVLVRGWYTRGR